MYELKVQAGVAHLWGMEALAWSEVNWPKLQRADVAHINTVIVPSYWGDFRTAVLAERFVAAGINPAMVRLSDAVATLGASAAKHSFLVELQSESTAITLLSWDENEHQTRYTHLVSISDSDILVETIIAMSYAMVAYPKQHIDQAICAEVIGSSGVTKYPDHWRDQAEFIIAENPPGRSSRRGYSVTELLHSRRFCAYDVPCDYLDSGPVASSGALLTEVSSTSDWEICDEGDLEADSWGEADDNARAHSGSEGFLQRHLRASAALATVVLIAGCGLVFAVADNRPHDAPGRGRSDVSGQSDIAAPTASSPSAVPSPSTGSPPKQSPTSSVPPEPRLVAAGVQAEFSRGWSLDPDAPADRLIALNGGDMRIIAQVHEVAAGTTLDDVVVRLSAAAASAQVSEVSRSAIDGMEMITHVERPASGQSVVLWHHRIEGQTQLLSGLSIQRQSDSSDPS